ncbi:MAG: hypothetical protein IT240_09015 [Bacteroidia bacterium]|nr:hypothetical protein [Bacteroidia bacterium]
MKTSGLLLLFLSLIAGLFPLSGQQTRSHFRKGNELYKEGKFNDAEIEYRKGL